jgi:hypothetical protein
MIWLKEEMKLLKVTLPQYPPKGAFTPDLTLGSCRGVATGPVRITPHWEAIWTLTKVVKVKE